LINVQRQWRHRWVSDDSDLKNNTVLFSTATRPAMGTSDSTTASTLLATSARFLFYQNILLETRATMEEHWYRMYRYDVIWVIIMSHTMIFSNFLLTSTPISEKTKMESKSDGATEYRATTSSQESFESYLILNDLEWSWMTSIDLDWPRLTSIFQNKKS